MIDEDSHIWIVTAVSLLLAPVTALGAVGNVINIKTFLHLGISDGVNMSLISLAASDLLYLISAFVSSISTMLHGVEELSSYKVWFSVDPEGLFTIFTSVASGVYAISMLVTTFITVVRCLAVANPIKYRNLISKKATVLIFTIFITVSIATSVLQLVYMGFHPEFYHSINKTRSTLLFSPQYSLTKDVIFGIRDVFLPLTSQTVVGICVVIMARYLQKAVHCRQQLSQANAGNTFAGSTVNAPVGNVNIPSKKHALFKSLGKEVKVVQQMLLIAMVYSLCNMPKVIFNLTQIIIPDFYRGRRYEGLYLIFNIIRELIQSVNASVTIFIYWKYNSRFRSHFNCIK